MKSQIKSVKFIYYKGLKNLRDSYSISVKGFPTYYFKNINAFQADVYAISYLYLGDHVYLEDLTRTEYTIGKEVYR